MQSLVNLLICIVNIDKGKAIWITTIPQNTLSKIHKVDKVYMGNEIFKL